MFNIIIGLVIGAIAGILIGMNNPTLAAAVKKQATAAQTKLGVKP